MMKINILSAGLLCFLGIFLIGCDEFLAENPDNRLVEDEVVATPEIAEGWLLVAYDRLPTSYNFNIDVVSDDAATNNVGSNLNAMNQGGWNSALNPIAIWNQVYEVNLYLNTFLENEDRVQWFPDPTMNSNFSNRIVAEARGLRAYWNFQLLQAHAGIGTNGELLGFPIVDGVLDPQDNLEIPRSTFVECYNYILADCNAALEEGGLPDKWTDSGVIDVDRVYGARNENRINGLAVKLIRSKLALYAASPAYSNSNATTWDEAAQYAAEAIEDYGGLNLSPQDVDFYLRNNSNEVIWASTNATNQRGMEGANYPPSLFGNGSTNPSQNFVDTFPMRNGEPINMSSSYNPNNPYANRDPRLAKYVIYDGLNFDGKIINTRLNADGASNPNVDALAFNQNSTITGYYLRKFMNEDVNLPGNGQPQGASHFYTYARFTELLLNFAEAANEAGGPDFEINGITPRQVINAIRLRGGITSTDYVDSITNTAAMRTLIHNERRIELSFEGNRFWDIRRWSKTDLIDENVRGLRISPDATSFEVFEASVRDYMPFQIYGPIPLAETQKYSIIQNQGY
ncbi:RagB/SusD family nutrient uptake outer membrane protein [Leeuwenhoekiella parthenopeia]|uniref:RagB/SusD family nutrient uptake outer membrane protein n=1 Tax=Leeuwenhoekiella parthenopeia TaxID=2890320 RepID=A0ABS8GMX9_9FLAO|nr:RagB/SusD family nutrient uptake outer membrane protein [Leeuwenhoekiella parthenopeia]MCC4211269.1 RagB/SusD family nutrient uptake outer membrane protein [Leeuwenhoekiella parthenopeia]